MRSLSKKCFLKNKLYSGDPSFTKTVLLFPEIGKPAVAKPQAGFLDSKHAFSESPKRDVSGSEPLINIKTKRTEEEICEELLGFSSGLSPIGESPEATRTTRSRCSKKINEIIHKCNRLEEKSKRFKTVVNK